MTRCQKKKAALIWGWCQIAISQYASAKKMTCGKLPKQINHWTVYGTGKEQRLKHRIFLSHLVGEWVRWYKLQPETSTHHDALSQPLSLFGRQFYLQACQKLSFFQQTTTDAVNLCQQNLKEAADAPAGYADYCTSTKIIFKVFIQHLLHFNSTSNYNSCSWKY